MPSVSPSTSVTDLDASVDENDEALAIRCAREPELFVILYRRRLEAVYRYHLARTGCVEDAQDLAAQTFLAAMEAIRGFKGKASFASWLFGIAHHKLVDFYRVKVDRADLEKYNAPDLGPRPEEQVMQRQQSERVAQAMQALAPERAEAVSLRIFGDLSAAEIGAVMGKSEPAVRMLVYRGFLDLKARLAPDFEGIR